MIDGLQRFNGLRAGEAEEMLYACFANRGWARRVAAGRPYRDLQEVTAAQDAAWSELSDADWLAAFAAHPRIGERGGHAPAQSKHEQSGVADAPAETLTALAAENREYEQRFGHVFLIAASGRTAGEILAALRSRMRNDAATELRVASEEQRKIARLRFERWLSS